MVTGEGVLVDHQVRIEGQHIVAVEPNAGPPDHELLTAGFIDLQVNGHDDVDVATAARDDWDRIDRLLLAQGVTSWCPTLVTSPVSVLDQRIAVLVDVAGRARSGPEIVGIHLEGPFIGEAHGAHHSVPDGPVDVDWLGALPDLVRVVTLGPEREGAVDAVELLVERGVLVALGHTRATFEQASTAIDAGARLFTHAFNASGPLHQRQPGALGAALADDRIAISLIADGVHVHPSVLKVAWRAKPRGKVALVTDATAWRAGRLAGAGVDLVDGAPRLVDGTLAGSSLTMDAAVRFMVSQVGAGLVETLAAASMVPAGLLGLDDRGVIAPGRRADLIALDADLSVVATWVGGRSL